MNKERNIGIGIWALFHIVLLIAFLGARHWTIDFSMTSILPEANALKEISNAEKKFSEQSLKQITILLGHKDFKTAKKATDKFDSIFKNNPQLKSVNYEISSASMDSLSGFVKEHAISLLGEKYTEAIRDSATGFEYARETALQKIYGAFSVADLSQLESDPFLFSATSFERVTLQSPLMQNNIGIRESRMTLSDSATTYLLWSATLSDSVSEFANEGHVIAEINRHLKQLQQEFKGLSVAKSGVPFHSFESSRNAEKEVAWISAISLSLVFFLLIFVFHSPLPILATLFSITIAAASSFAATAAVFKQIHIFTFIFGTSIIGVSIDYAIHFFTEFKYSQSKPSGAVVRNRIFKGLILGFMTTELGYIAISFAPFTLLKQTAVFSIAGLTSALFTVLFLFPSFHPTTRTCSLTLPQKAFKTSNFYETFSKRFPHFKVAFILLFAAFCILGLTRLNIRTDLRNVYSMSDEMRLAETTANRLLNFGSSGDYFIVKGKSAEEVLQAEEAFSKALDKAKADSTIRQYIAVSYFIPSQKKQAQTLQAITGNLLPHSQSLLHELGFKNDSAFQNALKNFSFLTPESELPHEWNRISKNFWIGQIGEFYYSVILPLHVKKSSPDDTSLGKIAYDFPNVTYVSKMSEINKSLTRLSTIALILVAIADITVFIILIFVYDFKSAFRIIRNPILATIITAAIFGLAGIDFNFFAIAGVILTLCIGIDYSLFFMEGSKRQGTTFLAITLSSLTTLLSFATLSFSSFAPVSTFGLSIFIGIVSSYLLSPLAKNNKK